MRPGTRGSKRFDSSPERETWQVEHDRGLEERRVKTGLIGSFTRMRTFEALQYRDFLLIWLGQASNSSGQWMDQITRGWLMYSLTGSPLALGGVSATRAIPMLCFSVIAGAVADRHGRKNQLIIAQVTNALLNWVLAALVLTHMVQPWHIYVTAVLAGLVQAFQQPARQSMISDIVPRDQIRNAVALNSMVLNSSRSIGPAVAGGLIAAVGPGGSYVIQGLMYAIASVWTVQVHEPAQWRPESALMTDGRGPSLLTSTMEGGRYIWNDATVRAVLMVVLVPSLLGQPYTSLMPIFARDVLHVGASGQGFLLTAAGVGALGGAIMVASLGNAGRQGLLMLGGAMVFGISIFGFATSEWFPLSLGLMALNGLFGVTYATQAQSILQTYTPAELRGRVMGIYLMNRSLVPLGSLAAGAMASVWGAQATVEVMGASCAVLALWALVTRPQIRALR